MERNLLQRLVETEDPLTTLWVSLLEVWEPHAKEVAEGRLSVKNYYALGEDASNRMERMLGKVFFDFYGHLLKAAKERSLMKALFPREVSVAVIMDSMSLREALLIVPELEKLGFTVKEFTYDLSGAPSDTGLYRLKNFGTEGIMQRRGLPFRVVPIAKERDADELKPVDEPSLVWSSFPDELMKGSSLEYDRIFNIAKDTLLKILAKVKVDKVIIASDHGYVADIGTWGVPTDHVRFFQRVFSIDRFKPMAKLGEKELKWVKELPMDSSYFLHDSEYVYVRGRYMWTVRGRRPVSFHGGISPMEVLTPFIVAKR